MNVLLDTDVFPPRDPKTVEYVEYIGSADEIFVAHAIHRVPMWIFKALYEEVL